MTKVEKRTTGTKWTAPCGWVGDLPYGLKFLPLALGAETLAGIRYLVQGITSLRLNGARENRRINVPASILV